MSTQLRTQVNRARQLRWSLDNRHLESQRESSWLRIPACPLPKRRSTIATSLRQARFYGYLVRGLGLCAPVAIECDQPLPLLWNFCGSPGMRLRKKRTAASKTPCSLKHYQRMTYGQSRMFLDD